MTAREFAVKAHGEQMYSEHPYAYHLDAVVDVLCEFGFRGIEFLIEGGYLHDVIEDCGVTVE